MKKISWKYSLQSKLFWIFAALLTVVCVGITSFCIHSFRTAYYQQADAYMADVTAQASVNENYVIGQINQLSVSVLIDNTVQKNLREINNLRNAEDSQTEIRHLGQEISGAVRADVFNLSSVVSLRIYTRYDNEIFVGSANRDTLELPVTEEEIYAANGKALWALSPDRHYICVCRAILSTNTMQPEGYMVIVCQNKAFCNALQTLSHSYRSHVYVLDETDTVVAANQEEAVGEVFHYWENSNGGTASTLTALITGEPCCYYIASQMDNGWQMVALVSTKQLQEAIAQSMMMVVLLALAAVIIAVAITLGAINRLIRPTRQLVETMGAFGRGKLDSRFEVRTSDEIGQIGDAYNSMAESIQNLMEKVYTLELAKKEAEIEILEMQLNPHFLYNTLDTISWLSIEGGNEDISEISVSLARLLRANIKNDTMITVEEEMGSIKDYLRIQQYRFGDKIEIHYDIAPEAEECYMPNFLLQPLVENSIIHGLENLAGRGDLFLSIRMTDEWLNFRIEDNGMGMTEEEVTRLLLKCTDMKSKKSIGLKNVYRRLHLLYGDSCAFHIESAREQGTKISFRIPAIKEISNEENVL